jgi:5-methylcytosine-specific restriction endonuclease McrA
VAQTREWRARFPEKSRACAARYQKAHPEVAANTQSKRRCGFGGVPTAYIKALRMLPYCMYCGKSSNETMQIEHMTPIARGGEHAVSNLTVSCRKCNQEKHTLTFEEFVLSRGDR